MFFVGPSQLAGRARFANAVCLTSSRYEPQSPGGTDRGTVFSTDTTIDSFLLSVFYDFRSTKQWSPFIGVSVGSTNVDHLDREDTGTSYGLALGIAYKTSDRTEVFFKSTGVVTPELDVLGITNGSYGNGTIGVRFIF